MTKQDAVDVLIAAAVCSYQIFVDCDFCPRNGGEKRCHAPKNVEIMEAVVLLRKGLYA